MRRAAVFGSLVLAGAALATFAWRTPPRLDAVAKTTMLGPAPAAVPAPAPKEIKLMQQEADTACRCAKQPGKGLRDPGCWAGFESRINRYKHSEVGTACLEESVVYVCFGSGAEVDFDKNCVWRERMYGACSDEEAVRQKAEARARRDGGCTG